LGDLVKNLCDDEVDVLILDGFRKLASEDLMVPKIINGRDISKGRKYGFSMSLSRKKSGCLLKSGWEKLYGRLAR
jgi:hypothetical protein